ncbi:unnamed protein product [Allacma fusca]|uniref:Uncharacterized protein n=1 Tax=Allacma fusca TaxID=39272 RepID=A0A8J2L4C2_9HEXA|nr:unnamed protein product [Allacma fusca]
MKSLQRRFDHVELPTNVLIAPVEYLYLWWDPLPKGKPRRCSDMRIKAMIDIKIQHKINGSVQGSYYDSFDTQRSSKFSNRVRKNDVQFVVLRLIGRSVSATEDIILPIPKGYPNTYEDHLPMPKSDETVAGIKIRHNNMNKPLLVTED